MGLNIKPLADRVLVEPAPAETKNSFWINHSRQRKRKTTKRNCLLPLVMVKLMSH